MEQPDPLPEPWAIMAVVVAIAVATYFSMIFLR